MATVQVAATRDDEEIPRRLRELQRSTPDSLHQAERSAVAYLNSLGVERFADTIHLDGQARWPAWAADSIVWTIGEIRARRWREAIRGFAQVREYRGQNGGFLPPGLSDAVGMIQNALESGLAPFCS